MSDDLTKPTSQQLPQRRSNMKITLRHRIEYILTFGLLKMMRFIGIDAASYLSGKLLRVIGPFLRGISRRSEENLTRFTRTGKRKKSNRSPPVSGKILAGWAVNLLILISLARHGTLKICVPSWSVLKKFMILIRPS